MNFGRKLSFIFIGKLDTNNFGVCTFSLKKHLFAASLKNKDEQKPHYS